MKTTTLWTRLGLAAAALAIVGTAAPALADSSVEGKTFGIGLEAGQGPGLSIKLQPDASYALQFGIAAYDYGRYRVDSHNKVYYGYGNGYGYTSGSVWLHGEYLATGGMLARKHGFSLPWYGGGGLDLGAGGGNTVAVGVHGNLGLALRLTAVPLDFFVEWTPRLWVIDFVQLHPVDANAGVRFWF